MQLPDHYSSDAREALALRKLTTGKISDLLMAKPADTGKHEALKLMHIVSAVCSSARAFCFARTMKDFA